MTDVQLLSQLFDEKLKGIHVKMDAEFSVLNLQLSQIKEQTTKTNNRVTHIEEDIVDLQEKGLTHIIECPNTKDIKDLNVDLREYRMLKKYPKIAIGIIVVASIMILLTTFEFQYKISKRTDANTLQVQKTENRIDSLEINN
jgi:DNA integrity scanning protein DisA with diadenylate cyclase activity